MTFFTRLYGIPHELLHVLALLLIGRLPKQVTIRHVDIPDDLSKWQYVFVAGLPSAVFALIWAVGVILLIGADDLLQVGIGLAISLLGGIGVAGGMGDLQLIWLRLFMDNEGKQ